MSMEHFLEGNGTLWPWKVNPERRAKLYLLLFSFGLMYQFLNRSIPARNSSIKALTKMKKRFNTISTNQNYYIYFLVRLKSLMINRHGCGVRTNFFCSSHVCDLVHEISLIVNSEVKECLR